MCGRPKWANRRAQRRGQSPRSTPSSVSESQQPGGHTQLLALFQLSKSVVAVTYMGLRHGSPRCAKDKDSCLLCVCVCVCVRARARAQASLWFCRFQFDTPQPSDIGPLPLFSTAPGIIIASPPMLKAERHKMGTAVQQIRPRMISGATRRATPPLHHAALNVV